MRVVEPEDEPDEAAEQHEWKRRAIAVPVALLLALAFHSWSAGHFMQRTALTMPLHELGHAVTGWLSGFACLPTLWKTRIPEARGVVTPVLVGGLGVALLALGGWARRLGLGVAGGVLAVLALYGTTRPVETAQVAITFGGDGGAMVLGTLLMCTFFVAPESRLRAGQLRYGLLAIGAAAFVDTFSLWSAARTDPDVIPFGEIEGVGLSDPSKLKDVYGWTERAIVHRYVTLGTLCLVALAAVWAWSVYAARRRARGAPAWRA